MLTAAPQKRILPQLRKLSKCFSSVAPEEEYTNTPQYPPILDLSFEKKIERKKVSKYDEIKAVKTVEEKQIKLNMPRYYGFKCYMFRENNVPFNTLPLIQHITRTHLIENSDLPSFYSSLNLDSVCERIKSQIEESLVFLNEGFQCKSKLKGEEITVEEQENAVATSISECINRIILNTLSDYPHIRDAEVLRFLSSL